MHVGFVDPLHRVAGLEEAFFVKGLGRLLGLAPVAGRDVRAAVTHLGLALHVHQLELQAGRGQAEVAGLHVGVGHEDAERAGLGHAQARAHDDAFADLALLAFEQAVPDRLCQRRTGVEEHVHLGQQRLAQQVVGLHRVGNGFEAGRHVEVHGGRDLAQVAQGLVHQRGRGLAVVDVQRTTVVDHHAEVVVAAEGVVPGQPVHQHQRLLGQHGHGLRHLLLVGAPQALRVDHGLGHLGRPRGEEELGDGVRPGGGHRGVHGGRGLGGQQRGERGGVAARHGAFGGDQFHAVTQRGEHGAAVAQRVAGKHQARRQRLHHVVQLVEVLADQRVGG